MKTNERIKSLRISNSMTQKELGLLVNASTVTVQSWESGKKSPSMSAIILLAKTFRVSTDYLLGVKPQPTFDTFLSISKKERSLINDYRKLDLHGQRIVKAVCSLELERCNEANAFEGDSRRQNPLRYIPKYITPSAAGMSTPLDGDDFEMIVVDDSVPMKADFAVTIQGDSMLPYIYDGETVFVERTSELNNGDIGIFSVNGSMYCKHFYLDKQKNLHLVSANPDLKNTNVLIDADSNDSCVCYGRVIMEQRVSMPEYFSEEPRI